MKVSLPVISIADTCLCFSFKKSLDDSWDVHSLDSRAFAMMAGKPAGRDFVHYFSGQPVVVFLFVVGWGFFVGRGRVGLFAFGGSGAVKQCFTAEIIVVGE